MIDFEFHLFMFMQEIQGGGKGVCGHHWEDVGGNIGVWSFLAPMLEESLEGKDPIVIAAFIIVCLFIIIILTHFWTQIWPLNMHKNSPKLASTSGLVKNFIK